MSPFQRTRRYDGRVVVVTGASSGIGRAIALELADRGGIVIGLARRTDLLEELSAELKTRNQACGTEVCDVSDADAYRAVLAKLEADHGRIDVLVNNAGIDLMLPVPGGNEADVHTVFDTNFFSTVAGTLAVVPGMLARGSGVVLNVSSDVVRAPEPRQGAYAASKAAISAFSESISHEIGARGVHVHLLYPGWVPTAMGLSGAEGGDGGTLPPKAVRRTADGVARLVADKMGRPVVDINAARLPLVAPIARTLFPRLYQRAMQRMGTT